MAAKRGLGKGLDALFSDSSPIVGDLFSEVMLAEIEPDREQPRSDFDEESLSELADSIRENGIIQPVILRALPGGGYRIISGERRFRAAHIAGLASVPAIIKDSDELKVIIAQLVENLQRKDLNPLEEAMGFKRLIDYEKITQEEAAKMVGKPRSSVTNALRLLSLPEHTQQLMRAGNITSGHAKVLLSVSEEKIDSTADSVVAEKLSVRELEKFINRGLKKQSSNSMKIKHPTALEVELALRETLGVEVFVKYSEGQGRLSVDFYSTEQLYDFANRLGGDFVIK